MDSGDPALGEGGELTLLNVTAVMGCGSRNVTGEDIGPVGGGELGVNMEVVWSQYGSTCVERRESEIQAGGKEGEERNLSSLCIPGTFLNASRVGGRYFFKFCRAGK